MSAHIAAAFEQARNPRVVGAPHPGLRPLLARGYSGYDAGAAPHDHMVRPATASVSLILKICDSALRPPAFVNGGHDRCAVIEGPCAPSYLEVRLAPLGAYTILGVPMSEVSARLVDLGELLGGDSDRLLEQVRAAPSWGRRFQTVDRYLLRRAQDGPRPAAAVSFAWQRLLTSSGTVPIKSIAADVGWSHKHLIAKFRQQAGLPPKTVARLVRFNRLLACLDRSALPDWHQIAAECGYADQAHLARDFREFTGTTPTGFVDGSRPADRAHDVRDHLIPLDHVPPAGQRLIAFKTGRDGRPYGAQRV
ncbi:helix-turn-helix domain-containing protein [Nonomuraea sp. NPDC050404]|uniref:helix-turn-helix domain-containing protein n=1 Tax=Nonomuraea sp. NPDC050404 TaxID=3155783 RepID=UPI0033DD4227